MKLAAQDGSLPEIVHLDSAEAPEYNEAGYLLDMSDFLKENKDIDDALDGMEDAFNDGKVQYGLPYQSNVQGFFYNKDLFDKAGIAYPTDDTTYDEFLDMIAKLKIQELHQSQSEVRTVDTQCGSSMNSFQDMDGKIMKILYW